jgi:hypothetical protein
MKVYAGWNRVSCGSTPLVDDTKTTAHNVLVDGVGVAKADKAGWVDLVRESIDVPCQAPVSLRVSVLPSQYISGLCECGVGSTHSGGIGGSHLDSLLGQGLVLGFWPGGIHALDGSGE